MNLTKGHNNLTKLNEIYICGWFCNEKQHMALDRNSISSRNFIIFLCFKIKYSKCQVSHKRRS